MKKFAIGLFLVSGAAFAADEPVNVNVMVKCQHGLGFEEAARVLNNDLRSDAVYAAMDNGDPSTFQRIVIRKPFKVSAPSAFSDQRTTSIGVCVTITKN